MTEDEYKDKIIKAGEIAIEELIKVAKEKIIKEKKASGEESEEDKNLAADRLKNAAATKKAAIFDAFDILKRIEEERSALELSRKKEVDEKEKKVNESSSGFAEGRAIK